MSREHFWPKWLIARTNTHQTGVKWSDGKKINPKAATFPLCEDCNQTFGRELESPVSRIFEDLENGIGLSDNEAELLIRWLWKMEGLAWLMTNPRPAYSPGFSLKDRTLNRIGEIRPHLCLAVSRIDKIDPSHGDLPLGLNSRNDRNAIFVSGVMSRVAVMCLLAGAQFHVPDNFSVYPLGTTKGTEDAKLFFPKIGFADDNEAVVVTKLVSRKLDDYHELLAKLSGPGSSTY
jgi:hypothetical protein